ncbi:putative exo-alpha-sialidase / neuraminidase [Hirsutella rhossiliensis]|uniref:Exo-alpha-sialidase / neuraminidase n=1 Tax=Hirsutella rhossiliensis TaxID=111463 RepID=A0A9P8SLE0_9HYPO|nr:putative exo-alpha-sialidase / neuraminidase [Hirsutella rhossiliensis]KAH0965061.1 putative exo-alpha-sialidase / neuraminidase [Hirsutella rhossiliensis]
MAQFVLLFVLCRVVVALQVTPGSPCAAYCLDSLEGNDFKASDSTTNPADVSCRDANYVTTDSGIKFRECVDCLQTSTKFAEGESDVKWYIYNLRYAISACLFSSPAAPPNKTADSPCGVDKACRPLKGALTSDDLQPAPQTSQDYCTADHGAFKRSNLSPCTKCLRATEGEAYLSNFLVALEAGCAQNPADGQVLGLSSSLFTADAVSAVNPPTSNQDDKKGQPGLTGSAIAGIVIGVVLLFVFAAALFIVYWRRQEALDSEDSDDEAKGLPGPNYPHLPGSNTGTTRVFRRGDAGQAFGGKASHFTSSGEYYDHMRAQGQSGRTVYASDFTINAPGSHSAIPTHYAYIPGTSSRAASRASPGRVPSPPASINRPEKTNRPDTFAIQAYLTAAEDSSRLAASSAPPAPRPKAPAAHGFRIPLASLPKLGIPKKPMLRHRAAETPTPGGLHRGVELQISEPVMGDDSRFSEPATVNTAAKQQKAGHCEDGYVEVPLRSGKSTLYGF